MRNHIGFLISKGVGGNKLSDSRKKFRDWLIEFSVEKVMEKNQKSLQFSLAKFS